MMKLGAPGYSSARRYFDGSRPCVAALVKAGDCRFHQPLAGFGASLFLEGGHGADEFLSGSLILPSIPTVASNHDCFFGTGNNPGAGRGMPRLSCRENRGGVFP